MSQKGDIPVTVEVNGAELPATDYFLGKTVHRFRINDIDCEFEFRWRDDAVNALIRLYDGKEDVLMELVNSREGGSVYEFEPLSPPHDFTATVWWTDDDAPPAIQKISNYHHALYALKAGDTIRVTTTADGEDVSESERNVYEGTVTELHDNRTSPLLTGREGFSREAASLIFESGDGTDYQIELYVSGVVDDYDASMKVEQIDTTYYVPSESVYSVDLLSRSSDWFPVYGASN